MKKTLKLMLVLLFAVITTTAFNSCTKETIRYHYRYNGVDNLEYKIGHETTANNFVRDLNNVMNSLDGTEFSDSDIKSKTRTVVNRYNNGYLEGTFYLQKSSSSSGPWSNIASYTLTSPYFKNSEEAILIGEKASLLK